MEPILATENLNVKFHNHQVLKGISFSVNKGDVLAIVGPNGAGKSVLFRALLGLIPYYGKIQWAKNIKINYVPQRFNINRDIPLSVAEFLKFKTPHLKNDGKTAKGSHFLSAGKTKNNNHIINSLKQVGLLDHGDDDYPLILNQRLGWLSGGQLQRVLIAWAILDNPDVLLFDEPTSGIDIGGEETIYNLILKLNKEHSMTILLISHELNIVYKYATSVMCLNKEMVCYGLPNEVLDPKSLAKLYGGETGFYKHEH